VKRNQLLSALLVMPVLLFPGISRGAPWFYAVTGPNGSNEIAADQIGQVVDFELDSTTADYVWGNVRVDFDPAILQCVYIEETPNASGLFTAWTPEPGDPAYGGGGALYYYLCDQEHPCSGWGQYWVDLYGPGAGPVASCDNAQGIIRFYIIGSDAGGLNLTEPLRIGFRVVQAGAAVFTTSANDWTAFGSPTLASTGPGTNASLLVAQTTSTYSWDLGDLPYQYVSAVSISPPSTLTVSIDVEPGSVKCFKNDGHGTIAVAVLGSATFDVTTIDPATLSLDGLTPKVTGRTQPRYDDANGDGVRDLLVEMTDVAGTYPVGQSTATLTGSLYGGAPIQGTDSICVVH